jgi:hypothetical protein
MALELRMSIESRYRVELPVMAISGGTNIRALAHRLLRSLRDTPGGGEEDDGLTTAEAGLLAMHGGRKSPDEGADIETEVALRSSAGAGS